MDEANRAAILADELQHMLESDTFRFFWRYVEKTREIEELNVLQTGKTEDATPEKIALALRYRQGVLDGVVKVMALKRDLFDQLREGRIPKLPVVVKDGS